MCCTHTRQYELGKENRGLNVDDKGKPRHPGKGGKGRRDGHRDMLNSTFGKTKKTRTRVRQAVAPGKSKRRYKKTA